MRTLNRPMFRYGGPIKEGVMSGIREPKKNGGLSKQFNTGLVGDERYPKTDGREHHLGFLAAVPWLANALRFAPAAYRGMKTARALTPWKQNLGKWGRFKDIFSPKKSITSPKFRKGDSTLPIGMRGPLKDRVTKIPFSERAGYNVGAFMRTNPVTSFGIASMVPQAGYLGYKAAKAAPGTIWEGTKRWADAVIPGDQSRWWKDKEPVKGVPLNPNLQKNLQKEAPVIDPEAAEAAALAKRQKELNERIKKYRDIMDIKGMNKQAAYKSLVDASKLIQESGDFKGDIKSGKLINQVIQAASKQFDKPAQASKAVDTLILQNELKKDLEAETKEQDKRYKESAIAVNEAKLAENTLAGDIRKYTSQTQALPTGSTLAGLATGRGYPIKGVEDVTIVKKWMKNNEGKNEVDYFQSIVTDAEVAPGLYVINDKILAVDENKKVTPVPLA